MLVSKERISILPEPKDLYQNLSDAFINEVEQHTQRGNGLTVILPIGPVGQYPLIAERCNKEKISLKNVRVILMDEYLDWQGRPIPVDHKLSFRKVFESFLAKLNPELRPEHWVIPDPFEINRIDDFITKHGEIDICYGGIGVQGHIAFNEPPVTRYGTVPLEEFRSSETRVVALAPETVTINALRGNDGNLADFPSMAVTIGMKHILSARRIRLFADGGSRQREALRRFIEGPETVYFPITLLRSHSDVKIVIDKNTAEGLTL